MAGRGTSVQRWRTRGCPGAPSHLQQSLSFHSLVGGQRHALPWHHPPLSNSSNCFAPFLTGSPGWSAALWRYRRRRGCVPAAHWWPGCGVAPQAGWAAGGGGRCRARRPAQPGAVQRREGVVTTCCSPQSCSLHSCPPGWMHTHRHPLPASTTVLCTPWPEPHTLFAWQDATPALPPAGTSALSPLPHLWLLTTVLPYLKG